MIGIIDYGMGNLRSVQKAFEHLGHQAEVCSHPHELNDKQLVILPGVGAFRDAISELKRKEFDKAIQDLIAEDKPLLGICLGMQLLFDRSFEDGEHDGLGIVPGTVERFLPEAGLKIPHMGWNGLQIKSANELTANLAEGDHVYFVHSYFVRPADPSVITTTTTHGTQEFVSIIQKGQVYATQFHPEKSQRVGLNLLNNFANLSAQTCT